MPIKDYKESEIRKAILKKINPDISPNNRSKHQKGKIYIDGKLEARVKIPNNHSRIMKNSKSKYIASELKLSSVEFSELIDCTLTGPMYIELLKNKSL